MVMAVCLLPATGHPNAAVVSRPAPAWGAVLLDESSISRGPDALAGGDRYSVELTETRN